MTAPVHILATCRKPELLPAALLVFKTLRLGFPLPPVVVYGNGLTASAAGEVQQAAAAAKASFNWIRPTAHDVWLEHLIATQNNPFWICDTDLVFLGGIPEPAAGTWLSGRFEPGFNEEWTRCWHAERLHTCLLYLDPVHLRAVMRSWLHQHVPPIFSHAGAEFVRQHFVPRYGQTPMFYDTAAGLYAAFGGTPFDAETDAAFEHLHCGTYSDLIGQCESLKDLPAVHSAVLADPAAARGLRVQQEKYYALRKD